MDRLYNDNYFPPSVTSLEPKEPIKIQHSINTNLTQLLPSFDENKSISHNVEKSNEM